MDRLTMLSDKGGVAFTFDLDITCKKTEIQKIFKLGQKLKAYEDTGLEPDEILSGLELAEIACMQIQYKKMQELLEQAAECIENCYGRETELSKAIRKEIN